MSTPHKVVLNEFDRRLESKLVGESMEAALKVLNKADTDVQIFTYDVNRTPFYQFASNDKKLRFTVELNENRSQRPKNPDGDCPVCLTNIKLKERQHWIAFSLANLVMVALANPYAFMPLHTTIANVSHEPQSWRACRSTDRRHKIEETLRGLYALAANLPTFIVIFNESAGSGASLPRHQHFQAFQLPSGHGPLAIQQVAMKSIKRRTAPIIYIGFQRDYPVCAGRFSGEQETVVSAAADLLEKWDHLLGEAATANLIAVTEREQVSVYVVLRNALFRYAPGFAGVMGALEMIGSFVLSSDWELELVRQGKIDFNILWDMLESVRPPEIGQFGKRLKS